jgi:hypothetical protein
MRTIFILCALVLIGGGVWFYQSTRMPNLYGTFTGAPKVEVGTLIEKPKDYLKKTVAIEGEVREQCETMGCYFYVHVGEKTLRVDLQDIAMNAPRKNGHMAKVEGQMVKYGDGFQLVATAVEFK